MTQDYQLDHLDELEAESMFVLREVAAQFERPAIFSGGKDSIVVTHLAAKAFPLPASPCRWCTSTPGTISETPEFRDVLAERLGYNSGGKVQATIDAGRVEETEHRSRNRLQTTTPSIPSKKASTTPASERRDEEKARAKERFFSHRDDFGQWDQTPAPRIVEPFQRQCMPGEHFRVFH